MGTAAGGLAGTVLVLVTLKTKGSQGLPARCSAPSTISNVAKSGPWEGQPPWALWRLHKWLRGVLGGGRQRAWLPPVAQDSPLLSLDSAPASCPKPLPQACLPQRVPGSTPISLPRPRPPVLGQLWPRHTDPAQLPAPASMSFKRARGRVFSGLVLSRVGGCHVAGRRGCKVKVARGSRQPPGARKKKGSGTGHLPPGPRRCALRGPLSGRWGWRRIPSAVSSPRTLVQT